MTPAAGFDPASAELVEFEQVSPNWKTRVKLPEGAVLEVEVSVGHVFRSGNDPNSGYPVYNVASSMVVRLISADSKLRKKPLRPGPASEIRGFA